jgi:hypothetical protein
MVPSRRVRHRGNESCDVVRNRGNWNAGLRLGGKSPDWNEAWPQCSEKRSKQVDPPGWENSSLGWQVDE